MASGNISEWPWYYFGGIGLALCILCAVPVIILFVRHQNNKNNAGNLLNSRKPSEAQKSTMGPIGQNAEIVPAQQADKWMANIQCECGCKTAVMMECGICKDETHYCSECGRAQAPCECDWESVSLEEADIDKGFSQMNQVNVQANTAAMAEGSNLDIPDAGWTEMSSYQESQNQGNEAIESDSSEHPARVRRDSIREAEMLRRKSVELGRQASRLREEKTAIDFERHALDRQLDSQMEAAARRKNKEPSEESEPQFDPHDWEHEHVDLTLQLKDLYNSTHNETDYI